MVGFQNLLLSDSKTPVCVAIGETVVVELTGGVCLTTSKKTLSSVSIYISDKSKITEIINDEVFRKASASLPQRKRKPQQALLNNEVQRKAHQSELRAKLNEEARARLVGCNNDSFDRKSLIPLNVCSYNSPDDIPSEIDVMGLKIFVDKRAESIIIPIFGMSVPFHISAIKSVSTNTEGNYTYLRINFHVVIPVGAKSEDLSIAYGKNVFIKEMIFRAPNIKSPSEPFSKSAALLSATNKIKDLQKSFKTKQQERIEMEGIIEQAELIINTSKVIPRIRDLSIRPQLGTRKVSGTLEVHTNGFRYANSVGDHVDILFSNIAHAIYQPPDNETLIILHFRLKHSIIINKKKYSDIQFYAEVGEAVVDLGRSGSRFAERDEIECEQSERETRKKLKLAFKSFIERVESITNRSLDFQVPFRELGFFGVPHKSSVFLMPTTMCLINIIEQPPFIVSLDEVELVHFERVGFNMKNFDMVLIFKDYKAKVCTISSIAMSYLEPIKDWLNSCDIKYNEGNQNLNWAKIMKTILDDPEEFFASGGWSFLDMDDENEDDSKLEEEEDEIYQPDESDDFEDEASDSDSEEYQSENSDSEEASEEESESGKSWSELEEEARQMDALKHGEIESSALKRKANFKYAPPPKRR